MRAWWVPALVLSGCGGSQASLLDSLEDTSGHRCPGVPQIAWSDSEVSVEALAVEGDTLYQWGWEVHSLDGVFEILDVSDLENVRRRGRVALTIEGIFGSIHPMGSVVLVAWLDYSVDRHHRVAAIDVSDPEAPAILSVTDLGEATSNPRFAVDGDRLFVGGRPSIEAIDFADPARPVVYDWPDPLPGAVAVRDGVLVAAAGFDLQLYTLDATMGPYPALATVTGAGHVDDLKATSVGFAGYSYDKVVAADGAGDGPAVVEQLGELGYVFESGARDDGLVLAHEAPGQTSLGLSWVDTSDTPSIEVQYIPDNVDFFSPVTDGDLVWAGGFRDSGPYFGGLIAVDMSPCN